MQELGFYGWLDNVGLTHYAKLCAHKLVVLIHTRGKSVSLNQAAEWIGVAMAERLRDYVLRHPTGFLRFEPAQQLFSSESHPFDAIEPVSRDPEYLPVIESAKAPGQYIGLMPLTEAGRYFVVSHYLVMKLERQLQESPLPCLEQVYHQLMATEGKLRPSPADMPKYIERRVQLLHSESKQPSATRSLADQLVLLTGGKRPSPISAVCQRYLKTS